MRTAKAASMFGIGFWEMLVIAGLVLIAVGPERLPGMLKQLAKFYRQFRRTAEDVRASTGIDQLLRDEELKELAEFRKQKLDLMGPIKTGPKAVPSPSSSVVKPAPKPAAAPEPSVPPTVSSKTAEAAPIAPVPAVKSALGPQGKSDVLRGLSAEAREREHPAIGVDLAEARHREPPPTRVEVAPEHIHPSKAALFKKAGA